MSWLQWCDVVQGTQNSRCSRAGTLQHPPRNHSLIWAWGIAGAPQVGLFSWVGASGWRWGLGISGFGASCNTACRMVGLGSLGPWTEALVSLIFRECPRACSASLAGSGWATSWTIHCVAYLWLGSSVGIPSPIWIPISSETLRTYYYL